MALDKRERPIYRLQSNESILDYIEPNQAEMVFKYYKDPLRLINLIDEKLYIRQSRNPINHPFKYIIAVATEKSWETN